jgi:hypothetical protein
MVLFFVELFLTGETKLNFTHFKILSKYRQNISKMTAEVYVKGTLIKFEPTQKKCVICDRLYGVCKKGFCSMCIKMGLGLGPKRELTKEIYREILTAKQYANAYEHHIKVKNTRKYEEMLVGIFDGKLKAAKMLEYCKEIPELPTPEELAQVMKEKWEPMLFFEEDAWKIIECIHGKMKESKKNYEYTHLVASRTVDYWKFHWLCKTQHHKWVNSVECYYGRNPFPEEKLFKMLMSRHLREECLDKNVYIKKLKEAEPIDVTHDKLCVICQDKESYFISLLCKHKCLCLTCSKLLIESGQKSCPICRQDHGDYVNEKVWNNMKERLLSFTREISWTNI